MHIAATCLHYGQEAFEGLKAFRGKDGKVRVFRMEENAKRIARSAEGIMMPALPQEKFEEMVRTVVRLNERYIPPYGSGASLYIRPLEVGMSAQVGVKPATEYLFHKTRPANDSATHHVMLSDVCRHRPAANNPNDTFRRRFIMSRVFVPAGNQNRRK